MATRMTDIELEQAREQKELRLAEMRAQHAQLGGADSG